MIDQEWTDAIDKFDRDVKQLIRQQPVAERLNLMDDLRAATTRILDDLMEREVAILAAEGYSKSRIANALGVTTKQVSRICEERSITTIRQSQVRPEAHDLRDKFKALDSDLALPDAGYRA
jgi:DNA-directed RNA polymerase specialized sigma subunit